MSNYKHRFLLFRTQHSMHSLIHLDFLNLRMGSSNPFLIILKWIFLFQHIKCFPHTFFRKKIQETRDSLVSQTIESAHNVRDPSSIPGLGRSPGEGNGNPLQYSCLENPMDGRASRATVHSVTKSQTQVHFHFFSYLFYRCLIIQWVFVGYYLSGPLWWDMWVVVFCFHSNRQYHTSLV